MTVSNERVASRFQRLAEERYKDGSSSSIYFPAELPPTLETILNHRSTRSFRLDGLPTDTLEALVLAGQSASSSSLLQTWDVVATQDPAHKDTAAKLAGDQDFLREAPLSLVFVANLRRLTSFSERHGQPRKALSSLDLFIMGALDAAIAGHKAALTAQCLGLGTYYIGAVRGNAQQMIELLGLPPHTFGVFGLAVR